uniref:NPC-like allergen n=1 Tax=Tyrophagus putrescentiae TaxID=59818 RepID=A0A977TJV4_TYRPU|nr:NPC-like allergen [Tyrophagus putrescentiae]
MNLPVFLLSVFLLVLLTGPTVNGKLVTLCDSPHGTFQSVSILNCKNTDRFCVFKKNTNVSIEVNFVPNYAATSVQTKIIGDVAGVPIPFPVNPKEACGNYGLNCPLTTGDKTQFKMELPIKAAYPAIAVGVTIKLVDESSANLVCLKFNAKITE